MKIAILTLPLLVNYGGILQAYALQSVLEKMGHEARVLSGTTRLRLKKAQALGKFLERAVKKYIKKRKDVRVFWEHWWNTFGRDHVQKEIRPFIDRHIHLFDAETLTKLKESDFDCYVVGSDQVWRPRYFRDKFIHATLEDAFLKFARNWNVKRVAYAPSFGTDQWEYTPAQTKACGELARLFDAVSVREADGVDACRMHLGVEATHVMDPTMLLRAEDYRALFEGTGTPESPGDLLVYLIDETAEKKALIASLARERNLEPFKVNDVAQDVTQPSVERWLRGFSDARFVVTDSFHACVFSILFKKPFVVVGNKKRGNARLHSLLNLFGLGDRIVSSPEDALRLPEIDYNAVTAAVEEKRAASLAFLKAALR